MAGGLNRNITVRLLADTSNFTAGMAKVSGESQKTATTMEAAGGKSKLITTGIAAAGVTATALGVAAVRMAADFDASMSTVQANTGASADEMNQLRQAAIDAGADTIYSATESADAINELGKAGLSTSDILSGGLSGALNLAASDGMAVGDAAELMATTLKQFNLTGAESTQVADALAAGAGKAVGSAHDLGLALNQAGLVANSMGVSMQETTGTLAAFTNAGMIGSDAGTSLKTMLQRLASPTDKAQTLMDELGINVYDANGKFIGLAGAAGQLQNGLSGLSQQERNAALNTIFGADAVRAANVLYEQGAEGIDDWTKAVSQSGYAADLAAKKNDNLKGDLENLSGSFESLMISLGEGGQGPLRSLVQTLDTLVDGFASLPAPVQQSIVLMAALVGGSVAVHKAMGPLNSSSSQLAQTLGLIADPGQRLIALGSRIASAFQTWGATFGSAESQINTFGTTISRSQGVMAGFKSIGSGLFAALGGPWGIALTVAGALLVGFAQSAQDAKANIKEFSSAIDQSGNAVETLIKKIASGEDKTWDFGDKFATGLGSLGEALDKAGIEYSTFAKAVNGSKEAQKLFDKQLKNAENNMSVMQTDSIRDSYNKLSDQVSKAKEQVSKTNEEVAKAGASGDTAAEGTNNYADSTDNATTGTKDLSDAIDDLVKGFLNLPGVQLSADQAVTQFNQGILDLNESIAKNGRVLDDNGNALAGYESQAYDSQSALQGLASTAQSTAQKIIEEGQAHGDAAAATQQAGDILERARQAYIANATAAGMSADAAAAQAERYGLARSEAANPVDVRITITDEASDVLDKVKVKAEKIDDKTVRLTGDDTDLMQKIADATNAKIDPKTGYLDLDKSQFDVAMAIAGGAKIDDKTGVLKGNNTPLFDKMVEANGWQIDPKTGYIYGKNGQALQAIRDVNNEPLETPREVTVTTNIVRNFIDNYMKNDVPDDSVGVRPPSKTGGLFTGYGVSMRGYAGGGSVIEGLLPGKASITGGDNITLANARVKSGEFVSNVKSVAYYGADTYAAMNRRQIPKESFSGRDIDVSGVIEEIRSFREQIGPIISAYAPQLGKRDLQRLTKEVLRT
ncbi:phage tail tape measure protein [Bifidobacterium longum]|uniref:phage tail tape measure protein n=1 Tax=Bifidobacterium longum TaxID=216816 RepID=UPI00103EE23E|nr:phage tail tape measure protein [Bifidobacterium longum]TCD76695.1 phage tail protein [Bifidobacterium longum subsp. longum]TCD86106.1 phage tail protein [Bifidobacterium longum subsp. longum]